MSIFLGYAAVSALLIVQIFSFGALATVALVFSLLVLLFTIAKVTGYVETNHMEIVHHYPILMTRITFPMEGVRKMKMENRKGGRGTTIRNMVVLTKDYNVLNFPCQLNGSILVEKK